MIIKLQKYYESSNLSGAVSSVIGLEIRENCTLKAVHVSVGANVSGANAVFALKKNGVAITGAGVTINISADENETTGLNEALAEGDKLDLALSSGAIDSPVVLTLTVDDGVTIDDLLPDQSGNAGKVLETDGVSASWQTPSGGGASLGKWDADKAQPAPHAFDDDFAGSSLDAKWSQFGAADVALTVADSLCVIKQTSQGSYKLSGIFQNLPAGNWDCVARIGHASFNLSDYAESGICLLENNGTADKIQLFSLYQNSTTLKVVQNSVWTNRTTFSATTQAPVLSESELNMAHRGYVYLRLQKSGTNYRAFISLNGFRWAANGVAHSIGFTPTKLGLCMYNQGTGVDVHLLCDWIRVYTTLPPYLGGGI